jgi:hypothetical protein
MGQLFSFFPKIVDLVKTSALAKVILVLVLIAIVVLALMPLLRKRKRKKLKEKETRNIMADLMVWRHVAQLAQGGDDHGKAKELLSDNIIKINELLKQGFDLAALHGRGLYGVPWYMLLGEPQAGKSALLQNSGLEMVASAAETAGSLPVRMWLGGKAVVCDVSGKVFFDRWLEGSSAEWTHIVKSICRNYRKPLAGAILAIPADALLADTGELTHKKAALMANELAHLLHSGGMCLPCYVVITKLDMVNGFREYAAGFSGELRHQILGFENDGKVYEPEQFRAFWDNLLKRLRAGRMKTSAWAAAEKLPPLANRMDIAGKIYLFPENFAALYGNLHIYLETLFGDTFHGTKDAVFDGLFFTSAADSGVSFSPEIARLAGKAADELALASSVLPANPPASQSYFIRDTLQQYIFNPSPYAAFTRKETFRRYVPQYLACAAMLVIGVIWLAAALFGTGRLKETLKEPAAYYKSIAAVFRANMPANSPLIKRNLDRTWELDGDSAAGKTATSRAQFYYNALVSRDARLIPPAGYLLSGLLVFSERNMGRGDRVFITNQLYDAMIRMPLIKNVGYRLIDDAAAAAAKKRQNPDKAILDRELKTAIQSFIQMDKLSGADFQQLFLSGQFNTDAMLRYLLPELSNDSVSLMNSFVPRYDKRAAFAADAAYVYSAEFLLAKQAALNIIIAAWQQSSVYPDSLYGKIKELSAVSQGIVANYGRLNAALQQVNTLTSIQEVEAAVTEWKRLMQTQTELIARGRRVFGEVKNLMADTGLPLAGALASADLPDPFAANLINDYLFNDIVIDYAVKEYTALFQNDMAFIRREGALGGNLNAVAVLEREFPGILNLELTNLRFDARNLKKNELLSTKMGKEADDPALFMVTEKILNLATAVDIPDPAKIETPSAMNGQYEILAAVDDYQNYVKPFAENEKVSALIGNARNMLLAQAYLNRHVVFNADYPFLSKSDDEIAGEVAARSKDGEVFSFSGRAIQSALGGVIFDRGYAPGVVKAITGEMAAFSGLFGQMGIKELPPFLQNQNLFQTGAFSAYLGKYIGYWRDYPEGIYAPVTTWWEYKERVAQNKPYQINSVLQSIYSECIGLLNGIDDAALSDVLKQDRDDAAKSLGDRVKLLSAFLSADADRMLSAWDRLPPDADAAFRQLQALPIEEVKSFYMTVYSETRNLSIGWWNDFIMNGITILSDNFRTLRLAAFAKKAGEWKAFPLCAGSGQDLPVSALPEMAALLKDLLAIRPGIPGIISPASGGEVPSGAVFKGEAARTWAQTLYRFAAAASDAKQPLLWTLSQPPIDDLAALPVKGRLLAVNRFRYVEVAGPEGAPRRFSTYMNETLPLTQGNPWDKGFSLKFFKTSADAAPAAEVRFDNPWSIFSLYLSKDAVAGGDGRRYIPVFLSDDAGQYVYFVEIGFNADIPPSEQWYSTATWPNLRVSGNAIATSF